MKIVDWALIKGGCGSFKIEINYNISLIGHKRHEGAGTIVARKAVERIGPSGRPDVAHLATATLH